MYSRCSDFKSTNNRYLKQEVANFGSLSEATDSSLGLFDMGNRLHYGH